MKKITTAKILFFFIAAVVLSSCQKVVVLDLNTAEPMLVIEGNITTKPGIPQTVFVSTSGSFYTAEGIEGVDDAIVILKSIEGMTDTLEMYQAGIYFSYGFTAEEDIEYSIEVLRQGEVYTGSEIFPTRKTIDSLSYVLNEGIFGDGLNEDGDTTFNVVVRFQDPEDTFDYYRFFISLGDSVVQAGFGSYDVTDDELFNGQLYSVEFLGTGAIRGDTITVELQSIGENTYTYYVGLNDALNSGGMGSTPYNPISNMSNDALGYFGAYTSDIDYIIVE